MNNRGHRRRILAGMLLLIVLLLAGCGRAKDEPTPTPTKTPIPDGAAVAQPTETPVPATGDVSNQPSQSGAQQPMGGGGQSQATEPEPTAPSVKTVAQIDASLLNVRSEPSEAGAIVTTVEQGARYDVLSQSDDGQWVQLSGNDGALGWVAADFVILSEEQMADTNAEPVQPSEPVAAQPTSAPAQTGGNYLPATMSSPDYGAQAFLWWREEIAQRDLRLMDEAGFNWVKQAFAWETIEGAGRNQYDWSIADRVVQQAADADLKLLARLSSDPDLNNFWAGQPPGNADAFAEYAYALASRYNCTPQAVGCIQAFQVWNEPNLAREWGGNRPNPAQYAEFLSKAYAAIKRGNPNAIVISAGMAPTGDNNDVAMPDDIFYDGMYQAMGGNSDGYFDMLGVHGAGFAAPPELDPATAASEQRYGGYRFFAFRHVEDIRNIMVKYGDSDKKIVLLEFGWTFDPVNASYKWHGADAGIDAAVQAAYLKGAYEWAAANWQPWIGLMSLLTMPNIDWLADGNPQDEEQYWWAILEPSQIDELKFRNAYVELCIYFNGLEGQRCKYDPN